MGGRGTYAAGRNVPYTYHTVGEIHGVKVLQKDEGASKLPEEAHSSSAYILLDNNGVFHQYREYDDGHRLTFEIGYHPEPNIDKSRKPVLHAHDYNGSIENRGLAKPLTKDELTRYKKYFKGVNL
ncbi:MAG: hypothetical protein PUD02_07310 [Eggerthellales bacterium]|nr:hypothetical protein [Eggerthellales bacterium]